MSQTVLDLPDEVAADPDVLTLADHLHALGDVDPALVLWHPLPGTATEADWLACNVKLVELFDATLVRKPMGMRESILAWA